MGAPLTEAPRRSPAQRRATRSGRWRPNLVAPAELVLHADARVSDNDVLIADEVQVEFVRLREMADHIAQD
eukprot:14763496-Alexandrium_andersonii.AAC.1